MLPVKNDPSNTEDNTSLIMTKQEREAFLADVHVGIISNSDEGRAADIERDLRPRVPRYLGKEMGDRYVEETRNLPTHADNVLIRMRPACTSKLSWRIALPSLQPRQEVCAPKSGERQRIRVARNKAAHGVSQVFNEEPPLAGISA